MPGSQFRYIDYRCGCRSSHGYDQPDQRREGKTRQSADLEPESMAQSKVTDHGESQQKRRGRRRSQSDQRNVDDAMQFLAAAAVLAGGEMQLVVSAHLGSQAGNIVAPSSKDLPHDRFDALTHKLLLPRL